MPTRTPKIMVVEPDSEILEILVAGLSGRFDAHLTCVDSAESCLDVEVVDPHDLIVAELELADSSGLDLTEHLMALSHRPVVLLADEPSTEQVLAALRLGVRDLLPKPFPVSQLLDAAEQALSGHHMRREHAVKYHRMRGLVRTAIRERRELNKRIELVCKDLVGAHRRLAHRVLEIGGSQSASPS